PRGRQNVDLLDPGKASDAVLSATLVDVARRSNAAVQLEAHLVLARCVVAGRHVQVIGELAAVRFDDAGGWVRLERSPALQASVGVLERDAGFDDVRSGFRGI